MKTLLVLVSVAASSLLAVPRLQAQSTPGSFASDSTCILAGRVDSDANWAPRFSHLELLGADGRVIKASGKEALAQVKQVRVKSPAWLSSCNAGKAISKSADGDVRPHTSAPALKSGETPIAVQAVSMLPVSLGGYWVELQVSPAADRVTMLASKRPK